MIERIPGRVTEAATTTLEIEYLMLSAIQYTDRRAGAGDGWEKEKDSLQWIRKFLGFGGKIRGGENGCSTSIFGAPELKNHSDFSTNCDEPLRIFPPES